MVLCKKMIKRMINKGMIVNMKLSECEDVSVNQASMDVTLSNEWFKPMGGGGEIVYGDKNIDNVEWIKNNYKVNNGDVSLDPGDVVCIFTREYLEIPKDVFGLLFNKASLGKLFINHLTCGIIESGFKGQLVIELKNNGPFKVVIPTGSQIAQIVFTDTSIIM